MTLLQQAIERLRLRIYPLGRFVHAFAGSLDAPTMVRPAIGFRYANPDFRHFCLLRAARIVSDLNGALELTGAGFPQQVGVLHRTVHEFCTHIELVIAQLERDGSTSGELAEFIADYFEDALRGGLPAKRKILHQKYVNELIGARLDENSGRDRTAADWKSAADMHRHVSFVFSNYVHGRYPETMDLYGGTPGRFHVHGMKGTPKDAENVVMLDALITTASRCFVDLVRGLKLQPLLKPDPMLTEWYQNLGD